MTELTKCQRGGKSHFSKIKKLFSNLFPFSTIIFSFTNLKATIFFLMIEVLGRNHIHTLAHVQISSRV